jgi:hypothetical protein
MSNEQAAPETKGVTAELLATVDLGSEIEGMAGHQLRMRMVTIEPGGVLVASPLVVYEPVEVVLRRGRGVLAVGERGAAAAGAVIADHRVILARSCPRLVEEEHGGRAHDGRICLVAQTARGDEPGSVAGDGEGLRRGADERRR